MNWKIINQPLGRSNLSGGYAPEKKHIWPVIAAAVAAGSAIYGGIKSAQANRKAERELEAERALTQAERRRKMYENILNRPDVQNVIRVVKQQADKINKQADGAAAVAGGTDASKQMAKEAGNNMVAEAAANIVANDAVRKDAVDAQYRAEERGIKQQLIGLEQQKGQNIANVAAQTGSALSEMATAYQGTKMGEGSPGGTGVTSTEEAVKASTKVNTPAPNALGNMGGSGTPIITPEMQIARYYKSMQGINQNASYLYSDPNIQRMIHERGGVPIY